MEMPEFGIKDSKLAERVVAVMARPTASDEQEKAVAKMLVDIGDKHIAAQWMYDLVMYCIDNYDALLERLSRVSGKKEVKA